MIRYFLLALCALGILLLAVFYGGVLPVYGAPGYLALALAGIVTALLIRRLKIPPSQSCIVFALAFAGYLMARAMISPIPFLALRDLFSIEAAIIVYIVTAFQLVETRQRLIFLGVLSLLLVAQAAVGVIQFTRGDNYMLQGIVRADYGIRASGLLICPNHFAGFAEIVTLMAFAVMIWGRTGYASKILLGYCGCVGLIAIVLSGSRGGYLSIAAGAGTLVALSLWLHIRSQRERLGRFIGIALTLILLSGGGIAWIFSKSDQLKVRAANIADTQNMRTLLWKSAWQQHKESPVVGTGAGTFSYYGRKYRDPSVQHDPIRVHNDYVELLAEYGWLGVVLFLVCFAVHLRHGWRAISWLVENRLIRSSKGQSTALALQIGGFASLAALVVHSTVDFNMHIPLNAMIVAWIFGILANPGVEMGVRASRREPVFFVGQAFAALLGLLLVFQILPTLQKEYYGEKARLALKKRNYLEAIAEAKKAIPSQNPTTYYVLGEARRRIAAETDLEKVRDSFLTSAVEAYRQAFTLYPNDSLVLLRLAECLDTLGKHDEAKTALGEVGRWDPNLGRYHAMLGRHYHLTGRHDEAKQEYQVAARLKGSLRTASEGLSRLADEKEAEKETAPVSNPVAPAP